MKKNQNPQNILNFSYLSWLNTNFPYITSVSRKKIRIFCFYSSKPFKPAVKSVKPVQHIKADVCYPSLPAGVFFDPSPVGYLKFKPSAKGNILIFIDPSTIFLEPSIFNNFRYTYYDRKSDLQKLFTNHLHKNFIYSVSLMGRLDKYNCTYNKKDIIITKEFMVYGYYSFLDWLRDLTKKIRIYF